MKYYCIGLASKASRYFLPRDVMIELRIPRTDEYRELIIITLKILTSNAI